MKRKYQTYIMLLLSLILIVFNLYLSGYRVSIGSLEQNYFKNYDITNYKQIKEFEDKYQVSRLYETENSYTLLSFVKSGFFYRANLGLTPTLNVGDVVIAKNVGTDHIEFFQVSRDELIVRNDGYKKITAEYPKSLEFGDLNFIRTDLQKINEDFYILKLRDIHKVPVHFIALTDDGRIETDYSDVLNIEESGEKFEVCVKGSCLTDQFINYESRLDYSLIKTLGLDTEEEFNTNPEALDLFSEAKDIVIKTITQEIRYNKKTNRLYIKNDTYLSEYYTSEKLIKEFEKQFYEYKEELAHEK